MLYLGGWFVGFGCLFVCLSYGNLLFIFDCGVIGLKDYLGFVSGEDCGWWISSVDVCMYVVIRIWDF